MSRKKPRNRIKASGEESSRFAGIMKEMAKEPLSLECAEMNKELNEIREVLDECEEVNEEPMTHYSRT